MPGLIKMDKISNRKKLEVMLIGSRHSVANSREFNIYLGRKVLKQSDHFSYLGVDIDSRLNWNNRVSRVTARMYPKLKQLNRISSFLSSKTLLRIYKQTILPVLDYGCIVWTDCVSKIRDDLNVYRTGQCVLSCQLTAKHVHKKCMASYHQYSCISCFQH